MFSLSCMCARSAMSVRRWKEMHTAARECVFQIAPITDRCLPSARRTAGRPAGERRERPRWLSCWCAQPNCTRREMIVAVLFSDWHRGRGTSWGIEAADYYVEYHAPSAKNWAMTTHDGKIFARRHFSRGNAGRFCSVIWFARSVERAVYSHTHDAVSNRNYGDYIFYFFVFDWNRWRRQVRKCHWEISTVLVWVYL